MCEKPAWILMDIKSDEHNLHDYEETKLIVREKIFTLHFDDPSSKTLAKQDSKHGPQVTEKNEKSQDEDIQNTSSEPLSTDFVMTEPLGIKVSQADDNGEYQAISHPLENEIQENSQQPDSIFHPLETENQENSQQPSSISHSLETEAQEYSQQPASISHPLETEIQMNNQQPSSISHPLETETQENNQQPSNISHPLETETQENNQQLSSSEVSIGRNLLLSVASLGGGGLLARTFFGTSEQAYIDRDLPKSESHFQLKIICLLWTVIATTNCLNCLIHCYGCSKPVTIVYTSFLWVLCYLILRQLDWTFEFWSLFLLKI